MNLECLPVSLLLLAGLLVRLGAFAWGGVRRYCMWHAWTKVLKRGGDGRAKAMGSYSTNSHYLHCRCVSTHFSGGKWYQIMSGADTSPPQQISGGFSLLHWTRKLPFSSLGWWGVNQHSTKQRWGPVAKRFPQFLSSSAGPTSQTGRRGCVGEPTQSSISPSLGASIFSDKPQSLPCCGLLFISSANILVPTGVVITSRPTSPL